MCMCVRAWVRESNDDLFRCYYGRITGLGPLAVISLGFDQFKRSTRVFFLSSISSAYSGTAIITITTQPSSLLKARSSRSSNLLENSFLATERNFPRTIKRIHVDHCVWTRTRVQKLLRTNDSSIPSLRFPQLSHRSFLFSGDFWPLRELSFHALFI